MSIQNIIGGRRIGLITWKSEIPLKNPLQKEEKNKDLKCCCGDGTKTLEMEIYWEILKE